MAAATTQAFNTPSKRGHAEFMEKRSRFVTACVPVKDETEASAVLNEVRKTHYNANHNVYAYVVGENGCQVKYSDDGEPQGTGGLTILTLLRGKNIINAIIIVTRYYGGIHLGTGGLTRAYGLGAKLALDDSAVVTRTLCEEYSLSISYAQYNKFQYEFNRSGFVILDTVYEAEITLTVRVESPSVPAFLALVSEISEGGVVPALVSKGYV